MKKSYILAVAAAAVLSACAKEEIKAPQSVETPVFTASIEGATKTVLAAGHDDAHKKVNWESTDKVNINGAVYAVAPGSPDASTATLTKESGDTPAGTFKAYCPASMYNAGTACLPASYSYTEGKFNMPMYAESGNTALAFKNICGVLAITVPSSQMASVNSIVVSSDQRMNGAFTASAEGVLTFAAAASADADRKVELAFTSAKAISGSETFYVPVPAGTHNPLSIVVSDGSSYRTMVTKKSGGVSVERNRIYSIAFADNQPTKGTAKANIGGHEVDVPWVQLWAGGPKFATVNIGQTVMDYSSINTTVTAENLYSVYSTDNVGGLYRWGGITNRRLTENYDSAADESSSTADISGTASDTATRIWGSNWRMPTDDELNKLFGAGGSYTEWAWMDGSESQYASGCTLAGRKITGKDAYAGNSLFLPAAGHQYSQDKEFAGTTGFYWSSAPYESNPGTDAYEYYTTNHSWTRGNTAKTRGNSVRAVLNE